MLRLKLFKKRQQVKKVSWTYILPRTYWEKEKEVLTPRQIFNANNGDPMDV